MGARYYRMTTGQDNDVHTYFGIDTAPPPDEYRWDGEAKTWVPLTGTPVTDYLHDGDTRFDEVTRAEVGAATGVPQKATA